MGFVIAFMTGCRHCKECGEYHQGHSNNLSDDDSGTDELQDDDISDDDLNDDDSGIDDDSIDDDTADDDSPSDDDSSDDDTVIDGFDWTKYTGSPAPGMAVMAAMSYDEMRQNIVLFSGGTGLSNETWLWDGTQWTKAQPTHSPAPRIGHGMAFDLAEEKIILFCGASIILYPRDTWAWDGNDWNKITTAHSPSGRAKFGMTYDRTREKIVVFGGCNGNPCENAFSDTWVFNGSDWSQVSTSNTPSERISPYMFFDEKLDKIILFGGLNDNGDLGDTWSFDGENWIQLLDGSKNSPDPRNAGACAYDPNRQRGLIFGGEAGYMDFRNDTWQWDGHKWQRLMPENAPHERNQTCGAYHRDQDHFIIFGGFFATDFLPMIFSDTWIYEYED